MSTRTVRDEEIPEQTTPTLSFQIQDGEEAGLLPTTLVLTLYAAAKESQQHKSIKGIINERSKQDVLNMNGVTVDASGNVSWQLEVDDTVIVADNVALESHIALFEWTYGPGAALAGKHEIEMKVRNLAAVPTVPA